MKRMIISPAQLKAINEAAIATYDTPNLGSALNTFSTNVQQKNIPALVNVQSGQDNPNAKSLTVKTDNGQVEQDALAGQSDGSVKDITFTPMNETRFSKRQVELGRMLEMRRTGKVFSKKQLNEMFMETQDNAEKLRELFGERIKLGFERNDTSAFRIAKVIDEEFPGEGRNLLAAVMDGADPTEYIINNIFSKEASDMEEKELMEKIEFVLERLKI